MRTVMIRWVRRCVLLALATAGCGGLRENDAKRILEERLAKGSGESCIWTHARGGEYIDVDHAGVRDCVQELEQAGVAKAGECRDPGAAGETCLSRRIAPQNGASHLPDGLAFRCGDFKLIEIVAIEEAGTDQVEVGYVRQFDGTLLPQILHCTGTTLLRPDAGQHTKKARFTRAADGKWGLDDHASWLF
jgi:hypothetical protein